MAECILHPKTDVSDRKTATTTTRRPVLRHYLWGEERREEGQVVTSHYS